MLTHHAALLGVPPSPEELSLLLFLGATETKPSMPKTQRYPGSNVKKLWSPAIINSISRLRF